MRDGQFGVQPDPRFFLHRVQNPVKGVFLLFVARTHAHHHIAVHLDEAPVAVPGERRVSRHFGEAFHGFVVEAEVENRVHHPGHGVAGAGTDRHQQGIPAGAELLAHLFLDAGHRRRNVAGKRRRILPFVFVIPGANLGADGEAGRHRQSDGGHFREIGALAAERLAHAGVAVGLPAEYVNELVADDGGSGLPGCEGCSHGIPFEKVHFSAVMTP